MIAAEIQKTGVSSIADVLRKNPWATWTGALHAILFLVFLVLFIVSFIMGRRPKL